MSKTKFWDPSQPEIPSREISNLMQALKSLTSIQNPKFVKNRFLEMELNQSHLLSCTREKAVVNFYATGATWNAPRMAADKVFQQC